MKTAFPGAIVIFITALLPHTATATHLRAIEIQVRHVDRPGTSVEIIVTAYVSLASGVLFGDGSLDFGFLNETAPPGETGRGGRRLCITTTFALY